MFRQDPDPTFFKFGSDLLEIRMRMPPKDPDPQPIGITTSLMSAG